MAELDATKYATWPGCTKKDNEHCLKCIWHSTLEGRYVTCDYSLDENHGIRDCRAGVGCKHFDTGRKSRGIHISKTRKNMVACVPEIFDALALLVGRRKMMELTGYTRTGLDSTKERGRIRSQAASSLYKETGIDISGGEIMGRETPDEF